MNACARGCTTDREHRPDCADKTCRGCHPRTAQHGTLCGWCYSTLRRDIATAPTLIHWLRQQIEPGPATSDGKTSGSRVPPAPLSVHAMAAADDFHAMLASWVLTILDEHPDQLAGPSWAGSVVRPTSKRRVTAYHDHLGYPAHLHYGPLAWADAVVYDPPSVVGVRPGQTPTVATATWLLARLDDDWTLWQEWAPEMVREVTGQTATLLARWPQEARSRNITDLPCPGCDRLSLVYYPVTVEKGNVLVQCEHHDCGRRVDEDKWSWYATVILDAWKTA